MLRRGTARPASSELNTPGNDTSHEMTDRRNRRFPLVRRPHVDKAVPAETGNRARMGRAATIR
jgi:hypothetical protein